MLNVAAHFDTDYIDEISTIPEVQVLFGRLPIDFVGGGCDASLLPNVSKSQLEAYVAHARAKGIRFNYVINAPSTNNAEFTTEGRRELNQLLEFLASLDLESVTVASPFLALYIRRNFRALKLKASANFAIDSVEKGRQVRDMGVEILVLDPLLVNRDFAALRAIRRALGDEIEILVNNNCLLNCPFLGYHQNYLGAASRSSQESPSADFCYAHCSRQRTSDAVAWIKADWVRPEDLAVYEEVGYTRFKVTDRCAPRDVLIRRARAYADRKYDGNLLDLIQHYYYRDSIEPSTYARNVHIDNAALDGFLRRFTQGRCNGRDCDAACDHCAAFARRAVRIDAQFTEAVAARKDREIASLLEP